MLHSFSNQHPYVILLIQHFHEQVKYGGVNDTLVALRERYCGRQIVKSVVQPYIICRKFESLSYSYVNSSDVPSYIVSQMTFPLLTQVTIDFAGPIYVCHTFSNNGSELKMNICLLPPPG